MKENFFESVYHIIRLNLLNKHCITNEASSVLTAGGGGENSVGLHIPLRANGVWHPGAEEGLFLLENNGWVEETTLREAVLNGVDPEE